MYAPVTRISTILNGTNGFEITDLGPGALTLGGDINKDGIADIVVGKKQQDRTYVVFGKKNGWNVSTSVTDLNGADGFLITAETAGDYNGAAVNAASDFNNDGITDLVIGAFCANQYSGKTYVLYGKTGAWNRTVSLGSLNGVNGFALTGEGIYDYSGIAVATGDINSDGYADIIIGAPGANNCRGRVYVVFGKSTGWGASMSLAGLNGVNGFTLDGNGDEVGRSLAVLDINKDGFADIVIGAVEPNDCTSAGNTYVVFGKASGWASSLSLGALDGTNGFSIPSLTPCDRTGLAVIGADINKDGFADLIIGANNATTAGKTYVVFGKASGWSSSIALGTLNGANGFVLTGETADDRSGTAVAAADINHDGIMDIVVGASNASSGFNAYAARTHTGKVYVVFGKAGGWNSSISLGSLDGTNGFALTGDGYDNIGSLLSAGTHYVQNSTYPTDLVIGAYSSTFVLFGQSLILSPAPTDAPTPAEVSAASSVFNNYSFFLEFFMGSQMFIFAAAFKLLQKLSTLF